MGLNNIGNGCGACSGFWKWFKPPHYKFFHEPCNKHDELYEIGGNFIDRLKADYVLLKDMLELVLVYYKGRKPLSKLWFIMLCFIYFIGVRIFGYTQFNYTKMKKLILNIGIFFSEIHKYYYAGGENTIVPTKNKYAIWLFPTQFIIYFTIYYILEMVIKLKTVYEWQTFVSLYLAVFTITTIPYSILSKIKWSWKLYFPYPFVWFMSYANKDEKNI